MGYCGADLRALCTEAALFALRRRYPQIYNTTEKLVLDTTKIRISSADFQNALKAIVPTAQRSDCSVARALPAHVRSLFLPSLKSLLSLVCFVFSPSWKAVKNASGEVEVLMKKELAFLTAIDQKLEELCNPVPSSFHHISQKGVPSSLSMEISSVNSIGCGSESMNRASQSLSAFGDISDKSRSKTVHKKSSRHESLSNVVGRSTFSGEVYEAALIDKSQGGHLGCLPDGVSTPKSYSVGHSLLDKKKQSRMEKASTQSFAHLHLRQQAQSTDLSRVFFDLTELSCEGMDVDGSGQRYREGSILEECQDKDRRSSSERRSTSRTPSLDLTRYLGMSSHPHVPPAVCHPRLVLCGRAGMGQSSYLAPSLLHALEDFPVKTMDLLTVFGSSTRSPEEACTQVRMISSH